MCFRRFLLFPALASAGKTRTYYIAVDETDWDYTPWVWTMMGMALDKNSQNISNR
jgi:hypothetical protein